MSPSPSECLLALDTSSETVHMALWAHGQVHVGAHEGGARASGTTLPGLQALLARAGLGWPDLSALAFGQGPGAFTGVRTACSVVQGLALALDKPVLALDTLMAVAEAARLADTPLARALARGEPSTLWVLQDARMGEVYAAAYALGPGGHWQTRQPPELWPLARLEERLAHGSGHAEIGFAAGTALATWPGLFSRLPADHQDASAQPSGQALAGLARQAWHQGHRLDAALALPVYVRDKVAQTTRERAELKAQATAGEAP